MFYSSGPAVATILFALAQEHFFPGSPVWPIGVFAIFMIFVFARYAKG
jgi:hypothetical protein